jgi:hypothetical protein
MFCLENGPAGPNERLAALGQVGSLSPESVPQDTPKEKRKSPRQAGIFPELVKKGRYPFLTKESRSDPRVQMGF